MSLVCRGKILSDIRHACERDKVGALMREHIDSKTTDYVSENIASKHLEGRDVNIDNFPPFESFPELTDIIALDGIVEEV